MQDFIISSIYFFYPSLKTSPEVAELDITSYWIYVYEWDFNGWTYSHMATPTVCGVMNLSIYPVVLESRAHSGGEAAAELCSRATRSTGGSDIGQSPRLL